MFWWYSTHCPIFNGYLYALLRVGWFHYMSHLKFDYSFVKVLQSFNEATLTKCRLNFDFFESWIL